MSGSWSDNEGVTALSRTADGLTGLAAAIPARRHIAPSNDAAPAELPIQNLPAHVKFARIWAERGAGILSQKQTRPCPLCGDTRRTTWFPTQDGYRYAICDVCGMIHIPEVLPLDVWDQYFADLPDAREFLHAQMTASIAPEALTASRERFGRYYELIGRQYGPLNGARLLDVGTHTGGALTIAAEAGLDAHGVEGLEEAVHFSRLHRPHLQITLGHAEDLPPAILGGAFDVVTMWETLEHTIDPMRALRNAHAALRPGGFLALTVPNARNVQCTVLREHCYFAYGGYQGIGHVNLFTPDSLRRAMRESGFELVHVQTEFGTDWRQVLYYLQHRFDRIYCFKALVESGDFMRNPEPELAVILNWVSPALTAIENACLAGPIIVALAQRRP